MEEVEENSGDEETKTGETEVKEAESEGSSDRGNEGSPVEKDEDVAGEDDGVNESEGDKDDDDDDPFGMEGSMSPRRSRGSEEDDEEREEGRRGGEGSVAEGSADGGDGEDEGRPLYVGNLSRDCTVQDVREILEMADAKVKRVELKIQYAFVYLEDDGENASVMQSLRGKVYKNRTVKVEEAKGDEVKRREKKRMEIAAQHESRILFVVGYDTRAAGVKANLEEAFGKFGPVEDVKLFETFAYVTLKEVDHAKSAYKEAQDAKIMVNGAELKVEYALKNPSEVGERRRNGPRSRGRRSPPRRRGGDLGRPPPRGYEGGPRRPYDAPPSYGRDDRRPRDAGSQAYARRGYDAPRAGHDYPPRSGNDLPPRGGAVHDASRRPVPRSGAYGAPRRDLDYPPRRDAYDPPRRDAYDPPRRDAYDPPRRDAYDPPRRDAYDPPRRDAYDPPRRDVYDPPRRDAYDRSRRDAYDPPRRDVYDPPRRDAYDPPRRDAYDPPRRDVDYPPRRENELPPAGLTRSYTDLPGRDRRPVGESPPAKRRRANDGYGRDLYDNHARKEALPGRPGGGERHTLDHPDSFRDRHDRKEPAGRDVYAGRPLSHAGDPYAPRRGSPRDEYSRRDLR
eukprot:CAMPEP_0119125778 /NCGR_PEP_ID=MMETSP1310-20130426/4942_1 /TAXON_ID=464262 /ORGANISM="Genus nov. species nov., Strain RCC2339" /LENGTH=619 /DNA_ID=CAMNT_0007115885 /DNA_START=32 /DNA_END=1891 /DNA_ORIENTATION=+